MEEPILVYDDDCGFCTWWAEVFAAHSDIETVGFSDMGELRDQLPDEYEECAHLVTEDGIYSCGEAIEEAFVRSDLGSPARPISERLRNQEWYGDLREWGYRFVAHNREFFGQIVSSDPPARDTE